MSNEVVTVHGEDVVVREDTAKAIRWIRFETIVISGIILLFIIGMLLFAGIFSIADPDLNQTNAVPNSSQPGP